MTESDVLSVDLENTDEVEEVDKIKSTKAKSGRTQIAKMIFTREFTFFLGIGFGVFLYMINQPFLAIFLPIIFIMLAGIKKVPTYYRGIWTFFGQRLPIAVGEGLRFCIPFFGDLILIDIRDKPEKLSYEKFVGKDGIPFSFTLFLVWHKARREDEVNWIWYKPWTWGPMIKAITNFEDGAARRLVLSLGKNRAEIELVKYAHNEVLGFSISELEELFKKDFEDIDLAKLVQSDSTIPLTNSETTNNIRNKIAEKVMFELNERLNNRGIIISEVAFEDFNLTEKMLNYIQDILQTKFEKASEMIDVKIDMQRVAMLIDEAHKAGITMHFIDAYKVMRGLDIGEIAAKQGGQLGLFLQGLIGKNSTLPEAVQRKIQLT